MPVLEARKQLGASISEVYSVAIVKTNMRSIGRMASAFALQGVNDEAIGLGCDPSSFPKIKDSA